MRISDWSSDVCSSDLGGGGGAGGGGGSAPPKLNVSVPSSECERKRVETSRPVWSTRSRLSALKKRYFRPTSMLSLSGRSAERRVGRACVVRVDLGGRRFLKTNHS